MTVTDTLETRIIQNTKNAVADLLQTSDINEFKEAIAGAVTTLTIESEDGTLVIVITKS